MRLIDAELFKKQVAAMTIRNGYIPEKANALCELIDSQPTAFDVGKVVKQLDKASDYYEFDEQGKEHVQMINLTEALEIVNSMTRAERRRQAKMQEKCQVPLNLNLTVAQVAGMTGQQASILQTYLKRMEQQKTEAVTDAVIREAQEKLERAEDYITITNIIISLYAIKFSWGFTKANKKFLKNWKAAMDYVDRIGVAKAYELAHKEMDIDVEFEDLANYNIYEEMGFNRE